MAANTPNTKNKQTINMAGLSTQNQDQSIKCVNFKATNRISSAVGKDILFTPNILSTYFYKNFNYIIFYLYG
jgi:hypothetical protein